MESDEKPTRSLEDIAKDLKKEKNGRRVSELADELDSALKKEDEKDEKKRTGQ